MHQPDFRSLAAHLTHLTPGELQDVRRTFDFAVAAHSGQTREDGSPYVTHVIEVAQILAGWHADRDTVIAALLHDVLEDTPVKKDEILEKFGRRVALLVEGITKFSQADLSPDLPLDRKIETLRKLFDVMRLDIRGVLIKLADRLHNVQTIGTLPTAERRRKFAIETLTIYYKIAFHLGMREVRRTFGDTCVPYAYDCGNEDRDLRDRLCKSGANIVGNIQHELLHEDPQHRVLKVFLQPRNLSIFHDRRTERGGEAQMADAFSISIVVKTEEDCYKLLKTLHTLHRPISGRFRDFVAAPSDAGYRSLHTFVALKDGTIVEVRIRTQEMYEQAMYGITMSLFRNAPEASNTFQWIKRSEKLDLQTRDSSSAFWEALESDILRETIPVTVDRRRISLPKGATALDAAYAIYNERASHTKTLMVNGRPVTLSEPLKEDDEVHVTFATEQQASFDWLQTVCTHHARFHIVDVLKRTSRSEKIALGATLLQKELDHYNKGLLSGLSRAQCQHVADHYRRENFDHVLSMIGEGVVRARDVVFYLYPDHQRQHALRAKGSGRYPFRLTVTMNQQVGQDALSQVNGVMRLNDITADSISVKTSRHPGFVDVHLSAHAPDRLRFADFIDALERQDSVSSVQALIPRFQKLVLLGAIVAAFCVTMLDFILFPQYKKLVESLSVIPQFTAEALPLLPILIVNFLLLRLLQQYVVRMRSDRWFLGVGFMLNLIGLLILILRMSVFGELKSGLYPLVVIFTLSLIAMGYAFYQTDMLFLPFEKRSMKPIPSAEWHFIRREKLIGYIIRTVAVIIWGTEVIYIKYTDVNLVSPFVRTFLLATGVTLFSAVLFGLQHLRRPAQRISFRLPYDGFFLLLVIGQVGYMYLKNASLLYTTGTNMLLLNNFAPLIGLFVAAAFWRREIPYLKQPRTMLSIFLLATAAGLGSSFLVYNSRMAGGQSLLGDGLAFLGTLFDVLLVVGQIQYVKKFRAMNPAVMNMHVFFFVLLCTAPVIIFARIAGISSFFAGLTPVTIGLGLGIGLFEGIGQLCNYEAFKRIDGYLAHMMFNFSVVISFLLETFFIGSVQPSVLLVLSGLLIIGASVAAEMVNSRCQKQGL